jgi:hypothetical protein
MGANSCHEVSAGSLLGVEKIVLGDSGIVELLWVIQKQWR